MKFDRNVNVGLFSKTMIPSFFKLCVIITCHECYKRASFLVTFDLYSRSHESRKLKLDSLHASKTIDLIKMKLGIDIAYG